MPRQPLVDSPDLPPYGQRSSERRKEQNRIAQRQLRERRLQQDAAQAAELERRQNEIERLTRMVKELRDENTRLKNQGPGTARRRQSVPISSLSRCLSGGTYGSASNIFSQGPSTLNPPSSVFHHERHSIDFGTLHRVNGTLSHPNTTKPDVVNIGDWSSEDDTIHCTTDLSDGERNATSPIGSYNSVLPANPNLTRERERCMSVSRPRKRSLQEVSDGEEEDHSKFEFPHFKKTKDVSGAQSLFSLPPTENVFKMSPTITKPIERMSTLEISPKQSSRTILDPNIPLTSFLPKTMLTNAKDNCSSFFEPYSPHSPSISPVASHRYPVGDDTFENPAQIRKSSTSGSSDISIANSIISTSDLQYEYPPYFSHFMPFQPMIISPQDVLGLKSSNPWNFNSATQDHSQNSQSSYQIPGPYFGFESRSSTQPEPAAISSAFDPSMNSIHPESSLPS
ncbi:hypothetical protein DFH28DRAFT_936339 [Melampsora americana]|nr:hypothetical protein DFH28DRAFT_936339 [Melampsora americana]